MCHDTYADHLYAGSPSRPVPVSSLVSITPLAKAVSPLYSGGRVTVESTRLAVNVIVAVSENTRPSAGSAADDWSEFHRKPAHDSAVDKCV